jgi:hypothetical protein
MHVELWANTKGTSRVIAIIRAESGGLQIETKEPVPPAILKDIEQQRQRLSGDEEFLKFLPVEFSGTYYRATLIT